MVPYVVVMEMGPRPTTRTATMATIDFNSSASFARQTWVCAAFDALKIKFEALGFTVPPAIRISVGFPKGRGGRNETIGQCWSASASGDGHYEIFISPELGGPTAGVTIIATIAHEIVHAVVGLEAKHNAPFKRCAEKVGLTGKMTATVPTQEFETYAEGLMKTIGIYPAGAVFILSIKKQTTRLLKCVCPECDYPVRVTRSWLDKSGAPICPTDNVQMEECK